MRGLAQLSETGRKPTIGDTRCIIFGHLTRMAVSSKLGRVRNFATSAHIQIMVVTVGAINKKDVNNLYKDSEKTGGEKPIDLIKPFDPGAREETPGGHAGGSPGWRALKSRKLHSPGNCAHDRFRPTDHPTHPECHRWSA